jgi:futalosine hydrolase
MTVLPRQPEVTHAPKRTRARRSQVRSSYLCVVILVVAATQREVEQLGSVDALVCGIGPVEAGVTTARALAERRPDAVLHIGIAGARGIAPPGIVLGSEAIYCDLEIASLPRTKSVAPDAELLRRAQAALPDALVRPIGTTAWVGGANGCDVEAMEGFAVLLAAQQAGIPALEVRAISNDPDEADRTKWRFAESLAALAGATERLLAELA